MRLVAAAPPAVPLIPPSSAIRGPSGSSVTASAHEGGGRDAVYVASVPLRATGGPAQLLASAGYSLRLWELQHFMVIVKRREGSSSEIRVPYLRLSSDPHHS